MPSKYNPKRQGLCRSGDGCDHTATVPSVITGRLAWCEHHGAELARIRELLGTTARASPKRAA